MPATHRLRWRTAERKFRGKYSRVARGDGGIQLDGDKHLSKPKSVQPVTVIVVFGEGFGVEDASIMDFAAVPARRAQNRFRRRWRAETR